MKKLTTLDFNPPNPIPKRRFQFAFDGVSIVLCNPPLPFDLRFIVAVGKRRTTVQMAMPIPRRRRCCRKALMILTAAYIHI